jgi:4-methyl-5(b-hydroxyethyl)-thiazole monophosphate biosynthesis
MALLLRGLPPAVAPVRASRTASRLLAEPLPRGRGRGTRQVCAATMASPPQKRVLVPIATGSEEIETACIVDILRRAGADVTVASCNPEGASLVVKMSRGMNFLADAAVTACADNMYHLIALPGGMPGASGLAASPVLHALLKAQAARGAPYAAMCAAPAVVLEPAGLLTGKAATAHPAFVEKLGERREAVDARVVVDGNCITSRGPGTALEFSLALVQVLFGPDKAAEVAKPLVLHPTSPSTQLLPHEWRLAQ